MEVKIYPRKKPLLIFMLLALIMVTGTNGYVFFFGSPEITGAHKYFSLAAVLLFLPGLFVLWRKYKSDIPTLVISRHTIEITKRLKPETVLWSEIEQWHIEEDEGTHYLVLKSSNKTRRINISLQDHTPEAIEAILRTIKAAG